MLLNNGSAPTWEKISENDNIKKYYRGNTVECTTTDIHEDGTVYLDGCKVEGIDVDYTYGKIFEDQADARIFIPATEETKTLAGIVPQGSFNPGDEYIINVDGTNKYHFYVLYTEDDKVNLILSGNICSNGTLATEENKCTIAWASNDDYIAAGGEINKNDQSACEYSDQCSTFNLGPITAMNYLYEATKTWSNIPNIEITGIGDDVGNRIQLVESNVAALISKDGATIATYENLKAKLPGFKDIGMAGCSTSQGSCPAWMVNGLNSYTSKYPIGTKDNISGMYGYWIFSVDSASNPPINCSSINSYGYFDYGSAVYDDGSYGVRPVITVPKSYLN